MDFVTNFEIEIGNTLKTIYPAINPSGYVYKTNTGQVQCYDEVLSLGRNVTSIVLPADDMKSVNHQYEQEENIGIVNNEWSTGQAAITNRVVYNIKSKVHNYGNEGDVKNAIRIRMNEVLSDLIYAFYQNYTLSGRVQWIKFLGAYREYEDITNNRIQTGTLLTQWEIVYSQSMNNPDRPACY
jgi:hypothetical protein